jgi:hypothetical protein
VHDHGTCSTCSIQTISTSTTVHDHGISTSPRYMTMASALYHSTRPCHQYFITVHDHGISTSPQYDHGISTSPQYISARHHKDSTAHTAIQQAHNRRQHITAITAQHTAHYSKQDYTGRYGHMGCLYMHMYTNSQTYIRYRLRFRFLLGLKYCVQNPA